MFFFVKAVRNLFVSLSHPKENNLLEERFQDPKKGEETAVEEQLDIRFRMSRLKEESRKLSIWLRAFWIIFVASGILLLVVGRRGPVVIYFVAYLVFFLSLGRGLAEKYKGFYLKRGDLFLDMKKYDAALASFKKVADIKGHSSEEALYKVALCLDRMKELYRAIGAYDHYLHKYPRGRWKDASQGALLALKEAKDKLREVPSEEPSASLPEETLAQKVAERLGKFTDPVKDSASRFASGQRVGDYILEFKISEGGFGEVWKAHHHLFQDRLVALKIPTHSDYISNLKKLGVIQNSLKSLHIVRPENINTESDPPHLAMEYVEGVDLEDLLKGGTKLSRGEVLYITRQILEALKVAHHHEVIHRDLKPANILIDRKGTVKLTDFELGKVNALTTSLSLSQSHTGKLQGTLLYMAPEQMKGEEVDNRADIYSLGVIIFQMVAGELPQPGDSLEDFDFAIPENLEKIFQGCYTRLEKRFSSVEEIETLLK